MLITSVKNGLISGVKCSWFLIRIIIPVYFGLTILRHTPAMDWLTGVFAPFMGVFSLPGEAAVPIITGFFLDEYAVIAAIRAVNLTGFPVTMVVVMALIAHSLVVEGFIVKKLGHSALFFTAYRLIIAAAVGLALSFLGVVLDLW